jgi:hypothetical protein
MLIKFNSVIINGVDKTGKVEDIDDKEALTMINLGYAELLDAPPKENYILHNPRLVDYPDVEKPDVIIDTFEISENTTKKKKWGLGNAGK